MPGRIRNSKDYWPKEKCPRCGTAMLEDFLRLILGCPKCENMFTHEEIHRIKSDKYREM